MGLLSVFLFTLLNLFTVANTAQAQSTPEQCLFERPLILGASVSAGAGVQGLGPATILSRRMNNEAQILNLARSATSSLQSTENHQVPQPPPTIVLAFDLFFWDAIQEKCDGEFIANTRRLLELYRIRKIPVVLGRLPVNAPFPSGLTWLGNRQCTAKINQVVDQLCRPENNCLIYDPNDCLRAMGAPKSPKGEPYFLDALHPSLLGNSFCAHQFIAAAKYRALKCR